MSFGSDFSGINDIDALWTFLEGEAEELIAFAQAVARRFVTPRGGLFYRQAYGLDLRGFLSDTARPDMVATQCNAEARKDERVIDCKTTITVTGESWRVVINPTADTGESPTLTLNVSAMSVDLLNVEP